MRITIALRISVWLIISLFAFREVRAAMTMKQLIQSMDMMRSVCVPKFPNLPIELVQNLRKGEFVENRDLKCYTACIAQMAGTITKKKEISLEKTISQLETMAPADMREMAVDAVMACKHVQYEYKDLCDKTFYATKCARDLHPAEFLFP